MREQKGERVVEGEKNGCIEEKTKCGDSVRSRFFTWIEDSVIAYTSTSCFPLCIIQVSNVLAVGWLTGQTAEDLSSCFIYVVRCSEMRHRDVK